MHAYLDRLRPRRFLRREGDGERGMIKYFRRRREKWRTFMHFLQYKYTSHCLYIIVHVPAIVQLAKNPTDEDVACVGCAPQHHA